MTTYSNLGIALIGTGEESGTWGTVTNDNLQYALQAPIANSVNVAVSGGGVTDTMAWNGSSNASQPARYLRLKLTGSGGGSGNLVVPTLSEGKNYIVDNASDSIITVKTASGTGTAIDPGDSRTVYQDGTDVVLVERYTGTVTFSTVNAGNLSVSGSVTGAGFTARFASPGPIGNVTPSTGFFSSLSATGNITLGDAAGDLVTFNSGTAAIPNNLILDGTGSLTLPKGTVAQRPTPVAGMIRYNTDTNVLEIYTGSAWVTALNSAAIGTTVQGYSTNLNALSTNGSGTGTGQYVQRPASQSIAIGSTWSVTESGGELFFSVGGVNKAKLDSSGAFVTVDDVTAFGTV
jgi:hypothetical protein